MESESSVDTIRSGWEFSLDEISQELAKLGVSAISSEQLHSIKHDLDELILSDHVSISSRSLNSASNRQNLCSTNCNEATSVNNQSPRSNVQSADQSDHSCCVIRRQPSTRCRDWAFPSADEETEAPNDFSDFTQTSGIELTSEGVLSFIGGDSIVRQRSTSCVNPIGCKSFSTKTRVPNTLEGSHIYKPYLSPACRSRDRVSKRVSVCPAYGQLGDAVTRSHRRSSTQTACTCLPQTSSRSTNPRSNTRLQHQSPERAGRKADAKNSHRKAFFGPRSRHDPVSRFHAYQAVWRSHPFTADGIHRALRWSVKAAMMVHEVAQLPSCTPRSATLKSLFAN